MAGTRFTLTVLIANVEKRRNEGRKPYADAVAAIGAQTYAEKIAQWRKAETARVLEFARRLRSRTEDVPDAELAGFGCNSQPPNGERYGDREARVALSRYDTNTDLILTFIRSLQADETGAVELSAADLRRLGFPS